MGIPASEVLAARAARVVEPLQIWPENWRSVRIAAAMMTQWRVGPAGAIGMDYTALPVVEVRIGGEPGDPADEFAALQVIEAEMLTLMRDKH